MHRAALMPQAVQHKSCRQPLGDHGGNGHTGHAPPEADYKNQVQHHIDRAGNGQVIHRPLSVTLGTQQHTAKVIGQFSRQTQKVESQVQNRRADNPVRGAHQFQQVRCPPDAQHHHDTAQKSGGQNGGMDHGTDPGSLSAAQRLRHHHVHTHAKSGKQIDRQIDERCGGGHRRLCRVTGKFAHHHDVRRIEQQLDQGCEHKRQCKPNDLAHQRPIGHINGVFFCSHGNPSASRSTQQMRRPTCGLRI